MVQVYPQLEGDKEGRPSRIGETENRNTDFRRGILGLNIHAAQVHPLHEESPRQAHIACVWHAQR